MGEATFALLGDAAVTDPVDKGRERAFRLLEVVEGVPALPRHLEAPLIGREKELAKLLEAYGSIVAERRCRLLLILGEAGIGRRASSMSLPMSSDKLPPSWSVAASPMVAGPPISRWRRSSGRSTSGSSSQRSLDRAGKQMRSPASWPN